MSNYIIVHNVPTSKYIHSVNCKEKRQITVHRSFFWKTIFCLFFLFG